MLWFQRRSFSRLYLLDVTKREGCVVMDTTKSENHLLLIMPRKLLTPANVIVMVIIGFLTGVVIRIFFLTRITVNISSGRSMSLLVKEKYDIGSILTLKSTCFICEEHDYGKKWQALNEDQVCQDVMFQVCFRNFTKQRRRTTKVASIVRRCDLNDCECSNMRQKTRDWHVVPNCATSVMCCDEKYLTCSKSYNFWFYTYFWTG